MPVIKFIEFDGTEHEVDADAGMSIMEVAMKYDVPGIDADCGGGAVCGTCHCFIEESAGPLPAVDPQEESMLGLRPDREGNSRPSGFFDEAVASTTHRTTTAVGVNARHVILHRHFHDAHSGISIDFVLGAIKLNELNYWHYLSLLNSLMRREL